MRKLIQLSMVGLLSLMLVPKAQASGELSEQTNLVELGAYGGVAFISRIHEFYDPDTKDQVPFKKGLPDIGLRLAYLPLSWMGGELEGGILPGKLDTGDNAMLWTFRAHLLLQLPLVQYFVPFGVVGGGMIGETSNKLGNDLDGTFHWGLGFKSYLTKWMDFRVDVRHVVSHRLVTADVQKGLTNSLEVLAGLGFVFGWEDHPKDTDGDGLTDDKDQCPTVAASTPDGCPPKDTDGDGITDDQDKCPTIAAATPDGCPPKDTDGDGITDDKDKCPTIAAHTPDGCPPKDTDNDGITDDKDKCPTQPETVNGFEDDDGCPDELPQQVKKFTGPIRGIQFATNSAGIKPASFTVLNQAAEVLKGYPTVRVVIRGHTDSRGSHDHNVALSLARAEAVRSYLVNQGVAMDRLSVEGLGPDEPIANNKKATGRAQNRRIEFQVIVGQADANATKAKPGVETPPTAP